ncbi:AAA family ATPase [Myxococcus sp. NMCA1]|uniref:AAA family ATPase n=1 Tax=Myxococcus sp. NMCA1 TaxID=2996785 RepID=UPI002285CC14|nr:AAA family ATPase [Myxococcus sp. NMCA1]WAM25165.1 AAA family ATPase [Myxococcus sp. NMCA1]
MIAPIRSVRIQNFRSVRDLTIDLAPDVTVFFGVNAAGKTTLLDAVAIGLGAIVARVPKATGLSFANHGDIRVPWKDRPDVYEKKGVECPFARVTISAANNLTWDVTKHRWAGDKARTPSAIGIKPLHEALDPIVEEALEGGQQQATSQRPIPLVAAYGTERAMVDVPLRQRDFKKEFHRLGALDNSLRTNTRFKTVFEWFVVAEDEERREQGRRKDFNYRNPTLEWIRGTVARAGLNCKNPRIETQPLRMVVDFKHSDGSLEVLDIAALSDGYRTHFSLIVDVARRMVQLNPSDDLSAKNRGTNSEAVILIDEIDLHLDPTWQATVVKGLRDAFPRAQLVLTTHSEQVIGSVPASSVRKLVAGDGEVLVENVPFAEGATSERILIDLMGAKERAGQVADGVNTKRLAEYMAMVTRGDGETNAAKELRAKLDEALPGDERLHQADLEMQKRSLLRQLKGGAQ